MKEYKGDVPDSLIKELSGLELHHLLGNRNCIMFSLDKLCYVKTPSCVTCLLVHPSWRSEVDAGMRDSLVEYLVDNNYIDKAIALQYILEKNRSQ